MYLFPHPRGGDWFTWRQADPVWLQAYSQVPGLELIPHPLGISVVLHRTHFPLLPAGVGFAPTSLVPEGAAAGRGHRCLQVAAGRGVELRHYQADDVPFLAHRRGSLLAYEMRLGKSVTSTVVHDPRDGMLVVVGPLASRDVWREWIPRVHGFSPIILQGMKDPEIHEGYPAYFIHYDILDAHTKFFATQKIGTLIFDEIHLLQGRKTKRAGASSMLSTRAERILGLSGTPMWSRPDSLYSLLHMIAPGAFGKHFDYARRYAGAMPGAHGWRYDGSSNEDEMRARLKEIMVRRTWADVAPQLPPTTRVVEPVSITGDDIAKLEAEAMRTVLAHGTNTTAGFLATLRRKVAQVKIAPAVAAARQAIQDGHKVVVWAWHREVADKIEKALAKPDKNALTLPPAIFRLKAEDSATLREEQVGRFREHATPCVMVAAIAIGGVAIDLSCSDFAIFAEFDWTPANMYQAEMRTFHPSRPHAVTYLYADTPMEFRLVQALGVREGFQTSLGMGFAEVARMVFSG